MAEPRYEAIGSKTITGSATAFYPFSDAPDGLEMLKLSVYGATLTLTFDGTTPVAGSTGHTYLANERVELNLNATSAKAVRAIDAAGGSTAYVTYFRF